MVGLRAWPTRDEPADVSCRPAWTPTRRTALSVNVNKVALLRNTRHLGIPSVVGRDAGAARPAPRHHRAPAPRRAPHPRARRARSGAACCEGSGRRPSTTSRATLPQPDGPARAGVRGRGRSSAPSCPTASTSSLPTTAGTSPTTRACARWSPSAKALGARQPVHGPVVPEMMRGARRRRRPRRALHRGLRARHGHAAAGGELAGFTPCGQAAQAPWAWASTPATT